MVAPVGNKSQQLADKTAGAQENTMNGAADGIGKLGAGLGNQAAGSVGSIAGGSHGGTGGGPTAQKTPVSGE